MVYRAVNRAPNGVGVGLPVLWRIVIEAVSESDRPIEMVPEA